MEPALLPLVSGRRIRSFPSVVKSHASLHLIHPLHIGVLFTSYTQASDTISLGAWDWLLAVRRTKFTAALSRQQSIDVLDELVGTEECGIVRALSPGSPNGRASSPSLSSNVECTVTWLVVRIRHPLTLEGLRPSPVGVLDRNIDKPNPLRPAGPVDHDRRRMQYKSRRLSGRHAIQTSDP